MVHAFPHIVAETNFITISKMEEGDVQIAQLIVKRVIQVYLMNAHHVWMGIIS